MATTISLDTLSRAGRCAHVYVTQFASWLAAHPSYLLYGALMPLLFIWLVPRALKKFQRPAKTRVGSPDLEKPSTTIPGKSKAAERPPGRWIPVDFQRPAPEPYPDWDVQTTKPLPYRPFKYGQYHITMGLRTMKWDEWIELDNHYPRFHADKARRIEERGKNCCRTAPEAFDGAVELLEEL